MKRKIALVTALFLVCTMALSTGTATAKSLKDIKSDIKDKNEQLEDGKQKELKLTKEVEDLEVKIGETENKIETLQKKVKKTESNITDAEVDLKDAQDKVDEQNKNLDVRLRTMYKNGSVGFLDVLMGSGSISEFISNIDMVKKVFANDKDVLANLEQTSKILEEKKLKLEKLQSGLQDSKNELAVQKSDLDADKKTISKKKSVVTAENEDLQDNIEDLQQEADRITSIIQGDGDSGGTYGGGVFGWPVPGHTRRSSEYGWRTCPFHGKEKHTGLDIPAPYGTAVHAAAKGKVIFSGYLGSYGNAIIISHGSNLYTLYGHNSSLVASKGQTVKKGQTIAKVGSTGNSTGNHCHFEVRKGGSDYGNDVSPWSYLRK